MTGFPKEIKQGSNTGPCWTPGVTYVYGHLLSCAIFTERFNIIKIYLEENRYGEVFSRTQAHNGPLSSSGS